jgi:acetyl esterase/lipase
MKKILLVSTITAVFAFSAQCEKVSLWPEGHVKGYAAIDWCEPPAQNVKKDVCMILISGGAYNSLCDVNLIEEWRKQFTALGVQCVNLIYRTPRPKAPKAIYSDAWMDGQRAVRLVRSEAAKRGFNPEKIGVISMSAGSHLATLLATSSMTSAYKKVDSLDDIPCHINWAIAFAPAYVLSDGSTGPNSREGDSVDVKIGSEFKFDKATAPMCLLHGGRDIYSPLGSTAIYRNLRRLKIPAEIHLYPDKGHGAYGFERGVEFMRQMGFLGPIGNEVPLQKRFRSDSDRAKYLGKIPVWPKNKMPRFVSMAKNKAFQQPYLEWHFPKKRTTDAIQVIWSGGAYMGNSPNSFEVEPVRRHLNSKGMTVVTVKYRVPRPKNAAKHLPAWQDVQRAIRMVKKDAPKFGLNPSKIGVMGSSAGGHLTLMAALSSKRKSYFPIDDLDRKYSPDVAWAIAIYPAYVLSDGENGCNKNGGNGDSDVIVDDFSFDLASAPILFIHGDADGYSPMGSVKVWERLRRMGIQSQLHTLAKRSHCFHRNAAPGTGSYTFLGRIDEFLAHRGILK